METRIGNICLALGFIEKHLCDDIAVEDMAAASGYSLYHFIRLFNQIVHHTPYDYLIRRRLCESADLVLSTKRKLIDIAMDFRFQNAETFSRAFNRIFLAQPSQVRKTGNLDQRIMLRARTAAHLRHFQHQQPLRPQIVLVGERIIAGFSSQEDLNTIKAVKLAEELRAFFPNREYWSWVLVFSNQMELAQPSKIVGCEIEALSAIELQLSARRLPAGFAAVFRHQGTTETLNLTRDFIYQTWAANTDERLDLSYEVCRFSFRKRSQDCEIIVPLRQR